MFDDSKKRKRILFLARAMPWPLHGGARLRDFNMLQALSADFEVDLLTVGRNQPQVSALCAEVHLPTPYYGDENIWLALCRWGAAGIETLRGPEPLWLTSKTNGTLRRAIRDLASDQSYDAILASELSSASALIGQTSTPFVYDAHNCEWRLLNSTREKQTGLRRLVLNREVPRLRAVERLAVTKSDMVFVTAQTDLDELRDLAGAEMAAVRVVPSTIDLDRYRGVREGTPEPGTVLVPGKYDWQPNLIGLEWFADEVMPVLRDKMAGQPLNVIVAGRMTDATRAKLEAIDNVTAAQNPDDMLDYFRRASAIAVPVLVSSGTRLRIAEGLASMRPIVSTTEGAAGLDPGAATPWLVANGTEGFADALSRILQDGALADAVARDGWDFVQALDWRSLRQPLAEAFGQIIGSRR
ncbi:glycosyltransferase [Roseobacter sinensis]|uniref:Glycosyltransferase n=1 Tax=Roseobacter sinensis TaxID=2931391 RepID=A0ABT3BJW5_9RHOB|nr:glycosyltransferase [Roseobacter sp. WL0113]MCV3273856.1 glycosyltransferase [Roseobacter sp. WL0113]